MCYFKTNSTIKLLILFLWNRRNIFPNLQDSFKTQLLQKNQTQKGAISHLHVYFSSSVAYCSSIITIILYLQGQTFKHSCHWRWHSLLCVKSIKIFTLFKFPHRTSAFLFISKYFWHYFYISVINGYLKIWDFPQRIQLKNNNNNKKRHNVCNRLKHQSTFILKHVIHPCENNSIWIVYVVYSESTISLRKKLGCTVVFQD